MDYKALTCSKYAAGLIEIPDKNHGGCNYPRGEAPKILLTMFSLLSISM